MRWKLFSTWVVSHMAATWAKVWKEDAPKRILLLQVFVSGMLVHENEIVVCFIDLLSWEWRVLKRNKHIKELKRIIFLHLSLFRHSDCSLLTIFDTCTRDYCEFPMHCYVKILRKWIWIVHLVVEAGRCSIEQARKSNPLTSEHVYGTF